MPTSAPPRIAVLSLGGTIGAPVDATGSNSEVRYEARTLVDSLGLPAESLALEPETFRRLMSADIGWGDVLALARRVQEVVAGGVQGVVITQGTDTLEEVAYLLDLLVDEAVPVVMTGAMRNPGRAGADGPANLADAVRVAATPSAAGFGVIVVLSGQIHRAATVRKTHTSSLAAFASPGSGPAGEVTEGRVWLQTRPADRLPALRPRSEAAPRVALHRASLGDDPDVLDAVAGLGYDGVVVEAYGAGHVGGRTVESLSRLSAVMPVVFCSRTGAGALYRSTGSYPGSEADLVGRGLIPADHLDGVKARALLMALIASGIRSREAIAEEYLRRGARSV